MKTGLVLEGGAMRGLYTAGILDVWIDEGVRVDALYGTIAGAIFGANLFSGQKGRGLRYNLRYMPDKRYMSVRSLLTTGDLISRDFAYYRISKELDPFDEAAFERYGGEFYAVATNVMTGEPECIRVDNVMEQLEVLRASAALPFVSKTVELNGKRYAGYEIHMGRSEEARGALFSMGNVYGSYVHGIFDEQEVADTILKALCTKKGVSFESLGTFDARAYKERQYDLLADAVRTGLDMPLIYRILNQEV